MQSVLCFGNAWLGGFMQKCVFQAVKAHMHGTPSGMHLLFYFWKKYLFFTDIQECVLNRMRRGHVTFLPRVFLLEDKNLSRALHT